MRILLPVLAGLLVCAPASADDQLVIGGEVEAPLRYIPALGGFVQGYVNGHGPFWFGIDLGGPTRLTPVVVKAAALALKPDVVVLNGSTGSIEQEPKTDDADIRVGEAVFRVTPNAIPDRDLGAYAPIDDYGGAIGAEILRNGVLTLDFAHGRLSLSPHGQDYASAGEVSVPVAMVEDRGTILAPMIALTVGSQTSNVFLSSRAGGISFLQFSMAGDAVFARAPHRYRRLNWSPDSSAEGELAPAAEVAAGEIPLGAHGVYRDAAPPPHSPEPGLSKRNLLNLRKIGVPRRLPVNDGIAGFESLASSVVRVDAAAQRIWLQPRRGDASPAAASRPYATIGFMPWPYRDRVVVRSLVLGSPADRAGLRPGDEVLALNGGGVNAYYSRLTVDRGEQPTTVTFRNLSGAHTVTLTPAAPRD